MWRVSWIAMAVCFALSGCSRGPRAIPALYVDAEQASQRAMELHDGNGDGLLDAQELAAAPGLKYAAQRADTDGDAKLSSAEIAAMIDSWNDKSIGLLTLRCNVRLGKRALQGATVRLEPEPFLAGQVETAIGLTDDVGDTYLTIPKEKRPIPEAPPGVQIGLYRVVISKIENGTEKVPSKYNEETTLGQEVSFDDPGVKNGINYRLKK